MSDNVYEIGDYIFIHKKHMSHQEWLDTRKDGTGGSDIGVIFGVNPWQDRNRLWFEKVSDFPSKDLSENNSVFWGVQLEDLILDTSQYFDPTDHEAYMRNKDAGDKRFSHVEFNFFIINKKYPWLRMNIDGMGFYDTTITKEDVEQMIFDGILPRPDKIIEIKTINQQAQDRWEDGVPEGYKLQVKGYLTVCHDMNPDIFGEIYSLVDGKQLNYHAIDYDQREINEVLEHTFDFDKSVLEGKKVWKLVVKREKELRREIAAKLREENKEVTEYAIDKHLDLHVDEQLSDLHMALEAMAPEAGDIKDYQDFLSEKHIRKETRKQDAVKGGPEEWALAVEHKKCLETKKTWEVATQKARNLLCQAMERKQTTIFDFGKDRGKVTFSKNLYNKIKNYAE